MAAVRHDDRTTRSSSAPASPGLSAAVRLTRDGARVLVLEARARLGGRATAFPDRETGELVDNGQHVLLGCYTETFAFLREIGAREPRAPPAAAGVTMIDRAGRRSRLDVSGAAGAAASARRRLRVGRADVARSAVGAAAWRRRCGSPGAKLARRSRRDAASPGETVENWLVRNGQTPRLREMLWDPLALAALNQPPRSGRRAAVCARARRDVRRRSARRRRSRCRPGRCTLMYAEPAREYIEARGGAVQHGRAGESSRRPAARVAGVDGRRRDAGRARVGDLGGAVVRARATCSTAMPPALAPLRRCARAAWRRRRSSPSTSGSTGRVLDEPFVGLPGRAMQWVFDKRLVFGDEASHLSLVSSGARTSSARTNERADRRGACASCSTAIPAARRRELVRATVVREPRATFSLAPGQPPRPSTDDARARLVSRRRLDRHRVCPRRSRARSAADTGPRTLQRHAESGHLVKIERTTPLNHSLTGCANDADTQSRLPDA